MELLSRRIYKGENFIMSEREVQLEREVSHYEELVADNLVDLEKAHMALNELLNEYEWDYTPSASKAIQYGSTVPSANTDREAKLSWRYIEDYKKIMWLVNIARDYCYSALESCNKVYSGGIVNE